MSHSSARRLLPQLLDGTLPIAIERGVRGHLTSCGRCQRDLADFELCDQLVTRLPQGIFPLIGAATSERRLEGLASWAFPRARPRWIALEGFAAALAAGALAGVVALAGATRWVPAHAPIPSGFAQVAYVMPGATER